jgi:hypothetical protein
MDDPGSVLPLALINATDGHKPAPYLELHTNDGFQGCRTRPCLALDFVLSLKTSSPGWAAFGQPGTLAKNRRMQAL